MSRRKQYGAKFRTEVETPDVRFGFTSGARRFRPFIFCMFSPVNPAQSTNNFVHFCADGL